jgi:hypothetical protein
MEPIEKYINENRESFDDLEPDEGHFERFTEKLDQEFGRSSRVYSSMTILKVAAVILFLITGTVFIFDFSMNKVKNSMESKSAGSLLAPEFQDAIRYYDMRTSDRMGEFRKLACCGEQQIHLTSILSKELNALDANSSGLQKELSEHPDNERVQAALIKNQQMKEQVVENMIAKLKVKSKKLRMKNEE